MDQQKIILPYNRIVKCFQCGSFGRCPVNVHLDLLPLSIACHQCSTAILIAKPMPFAKYPPNADAPYFTFKKLRRHELTGEYESVDTENKSVASENEKPLPGNFYVKANDLGEMTVKMFAKLAEMETDIHRFREQIAEHFKMVFYRSKMFESWQPKYIGEFIDNPFISIPAPCRDPLAAAYSRLLVSPKFFDIKAGVVIPSTGGFRLNLINQYTRMHLPLDHFQCKLFDVPPSIDLEVMGNKIIGGSLQLCWRDIPGLREDRDSNENCVSVVIREHHKARQWLARHGVCPWEDKPVKEVDLQVLRIDDAITQNHDFSLAWECFVQHGRIGIFWDDPQEARKFCTLAAHMVKGAVPVFVESTKHRMMWSAEKERKFIFMKNGDAIQLEHLFGCKTIIVDAYGDLDMEIIEKLFYYNGRIILIGGDYALDFNQENYIASVLHGLSVYPIYDRQDTSNWKEQWLSKAMPNLHESLARMQRVSSTNDSNQTQGTSTS